MFVRMATGTVDWKRKHHYWERLSVRAMSPVRLVDSALTGLD